MLHTVCITIAHNGLPRNTALHTLSVGESRLSWPSSYARNVAERPGRGTSEGTDQQAGQGSSYPLTSNIVATT